jgi:hypothetical protein
MMTTLLQICAVTLLAVATAQAFSVVPSTNRFVSTASLTSTSASSVAFSLSSRQHQQRFSPPLSMAASEGSEEEVETTEETASAEAELTDDEPVVELTESDADAAQEEEAAEDPELVALKEEISAMEKTLKERRVQVALTADTADDFTSGGYARKVAEMEQMRKNKRVSIVPYETGM